MKQLFTSLFLLLTLTAQGQSWQWGKRGGGSSNGLNVDPKEDVVDMATDTKGNVYALTVIEAQGVPNVSGGGSFAAYGSRDIGLVSYRCDGTFRWRKTIGGGNEDNPVALGVDTVGHLYITGLAISSQNATSIPASFEGDTTLPSTNQKFTFIAQYDTSGNLKWLRQPMPDTSGLGSNQRWQIFEIAVDWGGDVYCLAYLGTGLLSGSTQAVSTAGMYMMRYAVNGALVSLTPLQVGIIPGFSKIRQLRMARTRSGKFVLAGHYDINQFNPASGFTLGGQAVLNSMFVAMLDANGSVLWKRFSSDSNSGFYHRPSLDMQGNIFVSGQTVKTVQFNGSTFSNTLSAIGHQYPMAVKMDSLGNNVWATSSGTNGATYGYAGVLRGGEYVLTGGYPGKLQFPGLSTQLSHATNTGYDAFLVRLNAQTGQAIWLDSLAGNGAEDFGTALAADKSGNVYLGGRFSSSLSVAGTTLASAGGASDFFIAKYGSAACNCTVPVAAYTKTQNNIARSVTVTYTGSTTGLDSVVWLWGDGQRLKVTSNYTTSQTHTYAAGAGSQFNVCATTYSSCGQNQTCQAVGFTTAIKEVNAQEGGELLLYPNPAQETTTVRYRFATASAKRTVQVYDVTGRVMATLEAADLVGQWPVALDRWAAGVYQVVLKADGKVVATQRLSVTH